MEDGCPDPGPAHEAGIDGDIIKTDDIINGVVEQRYQTSDADNGQRLSCKNTENHSGKCRREESLIYTVEHACSAVHIEGVSQRGQKASRSQDVSSKPQGDHQLDKVHANGTSNSSISPCVGDIAPIVRQSSSDIMIHATSKA